MAASYTGSCFCGEVGIKVAGTPVAMGFCHCASCRSWSAAPVNAFTLWSSDSVQVTRGQDRVGTCHKTEMSHRQFCTACGGHLMTRHPTMNMVDVYAATIPDLPFQPSVHVFYADKVLPIHDGLPKMADMPAEFGGSGATLPE
jgi:hypothetical protein